MRAVLISVGLRSGRTRPLLPLGGCGGFSVLLLLLLLWLGGMFYFEGWREERAYISLMKRGLRPTYCKTRRPLSSRLCISVRKMGQSMSARPVDWTGVNM